MEYTILHNYLDPYKVVIKDNQAQIFKNGTNKLVLEQNFIGVFFGKSEADGTEYDGNTILLQVSEYSYIWVGNKVLKFMAYEKIVDYKSPVGNNQVPYPWAVDVRGWVYLFLESTVISNIGNPSNLSRPYDYYWFDGLGNICGSETLIKNFQSIQEFFIGNNSYTLTYKSFPDAEFDRLTNAFNSEIYVEKTDGIKYKLDKNTFCKLIKEFGEVSGLCPLDHMVVLDNIWSD